MANRKTELQIVIDAQDRTKGTFNALKSNLDGIKRSHEGLTSAMNTVGTAGAIAFGSLAYMTKGIIAAGAGFEQTQIAFETMLGSAEVAQKVLTNLGKFAQKTPFELPQLEEASKRLLAYGTSAEELIPTLEMLGNISAGVGMDKLPQLILAFGQVQAATKLTGAELRQFSEAGVPLLGTLADQLGKTEGEIIEMVSAGAIGFDQMKLALGSLSGEGGKFFNLMERQSASLGGLWSNLKDQISLTARAIGEEMLPYLKPLVEQMIGFAKVIGEFVKEHPKFTAGILIATLAFTLLLAALLPLAIALPGLVLLFTGIGAAFAFVATMSAPVLLAVGAVIALLAALGTQGYFTKQAWEEVWIGMKVIAVESANAVIGTVESMVNFVIDGVNLAIKAINKVIEAASKVPGFGKASSISISTLERASFGRLDADTIAAQGFGSAGSSAVQNVVQVSGNTFLSAEVAEQIGDMILGKLKMSSAV